LRVVLLGISGAGKGTQAKRLAARYNVPHVSSGDLLRAANIEEAHRALIDSGRLVPDDVVELLIQDYVAAGSYILDGYPRTLTQAETLERKTESLGKPLDKAVSIDVPDGLILERLTGRLVCPACGNMYHIKNYPPKKAGVCDVCGHALITREDDKEHTVARRLKLYHETTEPILDFYAGRGVLLRVDGSKGPDEVTKSVTDVLDGGF
jgi:adenylate kinase